MPVEAALEEVDERRDVAAQPHAPAGLLEVLAPHAAKLRVVANQVGELAALLHEVAAREPVDLLLESDTPSSSLSTTPESLKLRVWSKSDATRKCFGGVVSMTWALCCCRSRYIN